MSELLRKGQREAIQGRARKYRLGITLRLQEVGNELVNYELTLRHAEKCVQAALDTGTELSRRLAQAVTERDAYRGVVDILCSYGTRDSAVLSYRALAVEARNSEAANEWRVVAHYEALAKALEEMPRLDLIAAEVMP